MKSQQQLFGRSAGRSSAIGWGRGVQQKPTVGPGVGPGSYDLSASGALKKGVRSSCSRAVWAQVVGGNSGVGGKAGAAAAAATAGGFGSTCSRFEDAGSVSPGPGERGCSAKHFRLLWFANAVIALGLLLPIWQHL